VNYGKSQTRLTEAIWINDVSIWAYRSTMSNCVKKEYWLLSKIYHGVIWCTMGQNKITSGGKEYSWTFMELLAWLIREKKTSIHFGSLFMSFESIMDFTKKIPSIVSLIASIEFNDSFRVQFYIQWTYE